MADEARFDPTVTPNGLANFAPKPKAERAGVGLCLSGGGYRAALFHLGALCRLNELGVLAQITTISSVSGGSIISAHLATTVRWPIAGVIDDWETRVAEPFRRFVRTTNLRNTPILKRVLPWNWFNSSIQVETLASEYRRLTPLMLTDLPDSPVFIYCATDLAYGVNWICEKKHIGDYEAGFIDTHVCNWPLSRAVAVSSCFPPVFDPLRLHFSPGQFTGGKAPRGSEDIRSGIALSDGGVYDNLGLEPVWKDHRIVMCSDGGALFDFTADKDILGRIKRYISIPENQALAVRKRWLVSNFISGQLDGTYWGIGSLVENYHSPHVGYAEVAVSRIAAIRTDLDRFSDAEISILENHGYSVADAAVNRHLHTMITVPADLAIPHQSYMDEKVVMTELRDSAKRKLLGH